MFLGGHTGVTSTSPLRKSCCYAYSHQWTNVVLSGWL